MGSKQVQGRARRYPKACGSRPQAGYRQQRPSPGVGKPMEKKPLHDSRCSAAYKPRCLFVVVDSDPRMQNV